MKNPSLDLIAIAILGALIIVTFVLYLFAFEAQARREPWPISPSLFLYVAWASALGAGIFCVRHIARSRRNMRNK